MSIVAVAARVAQIQQMLEPVGAPASSTGGFQAALSSATAAGASAVPGASSGSAVGSAGVAGPAAAPFGATAGLSPAAAPLSGGPYAAEINAAAARNGVDPALLRSLVRAESNFNPRAQSAAGARGLTQLMPGTAAGLGVTDPFDPVQSLEGGAKYLRSMLDRFGGDEAKALAAYNAGPGAVQQYGGIPPYAETQAYVQRIMGWVAQERGAGAGSSLSYSTT